MRNRWGNSGNSVRLYFVGSKITANGDFSNEIKRNLLLGRKVMTNLDSIFKSGDITLLTKVCLVKALVFQWSCMAVRVGLWRKLSTEELMLLNCGVGEDSFNFMAAGTICSDFGAQKNKVCHCFPIYFPWSDGTGRHEIKRRLLLGRKVMTNLDSIFKNRDLLCRLRSI